MPTRTYTIDFQNVNTQNTLAGIHALTQALTQLNAASAQATASLKGVVAGAGQAKEGAESFLTSMLALKAAGLVIDEVKFAAKALADSLQAARDFARQTAEENLKLREILREFKFLKGEVGGGDRLPEDVLKFAAQTGMKPEESAKFLKAQADALATLPEGQRPSEAVNREAARQMAILTARADMDPTKAGQIAGIMGMYGELKTPEAATDRMGKIANAMGKNSIFDFKQMMPAFTGLMAEMSGDGGRVPKPEDLAVVFSAVTARTRNSASAATAVRRANRLLRRLDGKSGDLLKEFGVTEDDDMIAALRKVAPHVVGGKGDRFLKKHGFNNMAEIADVVRLAQSLPKIEEGLADNAKPGAGRKLAEENAKALAEDPALLNRRAETAQAIVRHTEGMSNERLAVARKQAEARLISRGTINPDGKRTTGQAIRDHANPFGEWAREVDVDNEIRQRVLDVAAKHGIKDEVRRAGKRAGGFEDATERGKNFEAMLGELERQAPGSAREVFDDSRLVGKMDEAVEQLKTLNRGAIGRPLASPARTLGGAGAAGGAALPITPSRP
jgi:hypothetical protein